MANIPENLAPGEKIIALIEGQAFEITAGANNELIAKQVSEDTLVSENYQTVTDSSSISNTNNNNISLEDLANISAKQENLKLVDGNDQMQILIMPNDTNQQQQQQPQQQQQQQQPLQQINGAANSSGDFVIQPGQQIPAELQELISKGNLAGLDLSNYEFVIQEDNGSAGGDQQNNQQVILTTGPQGQIDTQALQEILQQHQQQQQQQQQQQNFINTSSMNNTHVLALLAEASSTVAQNDTNEIIGKGSVVLSDDEDDTEFDSLRDAPDPGEPALMISGPVNLQAKFESHVNSKYASAFSSYVQGIKPETLASVANSTIFKKPPLPPYIPEFCPNRRQKGALGMAFGGNKFYKKKYEMDPSTKNYIRKQDRMTSRIIRKEKGSDDDSYDEMLDLEENYGSDSDDSDPGWRPPTDSGKKTQPIMSVTPKPPRGGRGRGRPRGSRSGNTAGRNLMKEDRINGGPANQTSVTVISAAPNDPHYYQKGDFVLERKDYYKQEGFPIWKIEAGRLLQKFDPVLMDNELLHKSASIYSSWSGDIRSSFRAILVDVVNTTGRRQEMVHVLPEYLPKPFDQSLEQDALIDLFNIYAQNIVSQYLDSSFINAIHLHQESYYLEPLKQIDSLLVEAQKTILSQITWTTKFKDAIDTLPHYRISDLSTISQEKFACQVSFVFSRFKIFFNLCQRWLKTTLLIALSPQATGNTSSVAVKIVNFFGLTYDPNTLERFREVEMTSAENFLICQAAVDMMTIYHALHHYKYLFYKSAAEEVNYRRIQSKDKGDKDLLEECCSNRIWVQQHLRNLKELLAKCSIVISVVTQYEDEPKQQADQPPADQQASDAAPVGADTASQDNQQEQQMALSEQQQQQAALLQQQQQQQALLQQQQQQQQNQADQPDKQFQLLDIHKQEPQQQQQQAAQGDQGVALMQIDESGNMVQLEQGASAAAASGATVVLGAGELEGISAGSLGNSQAIGYIQLEDGSYVQAVYDPSMVNLLQQQQLDLTQQQQQQADQPEQQQVLAELTAEQQQLLTELSPEQQQQYLEQILLEQQQQQQQLLQSAEAVKDEADQEAGEQDSQADKQAEETAQQESHVTSEQTGNAEATQEAQQKEEQEEQEAQQPQQEEQQTEQQQQQQLTEEEQQQTKEEQQQTQQEPSEDQLLQQQSIDSMLQQQASTSQEEKEELMDES